MFKFEINVMKKTIIAPWHEN